MNKYHSQFPDKTTLGLTKREWTKQITQFTREELHGAIEEAKTIRAAGKRDKKQNLLFEWPDIAQILALLNKSISPSGGNADAYLAITDPRHSCYVEPVLGIESDQSEQKRLDTGKKALSGMLEEFANPPCLFCQTPNPKYKSFGNDYCDKTCESKFIDKAFAEDQKKKKQREKEERQKNGQ